jgi:hypothetical protein
MKTIHKQELAKILHRLNEITDTTLLKGAGYSDPATQEPATDQPTQTAPQQTSADVQNLQRATQNAAPVQRAGSYINTTDEFKGALTQMLNTVKYKPTSIAQAQYLLGQAMKQMGYK